MIICSFYRPPNNNIQSVKDLCDLFTNITATYPNIPIWLVGDLNLPNIDWENTCIQGSAYPLYFCVMSEAEDVVIWHNNVNPPMNWPILELIKISSQVKCAVLQNHQKSSSISVPHDHLTQSSSTTHGHSMRYLYSWRQEQTHICTPQFPSTWHQNA